MNVDYIDIHSHLHFSIYDGDRKEVLERMKEAGVGTISVGVDAGTSEEEVELAENNPFVWSCVGVHPAEDTDTGDFDKTRDVFERLVRSQEVVSIGECGLDFSRLEGNDTAEKTRQKKDFEAQIEFAVEHDLPVMIHTRDAMQETLELLEAKKREHGEKLRGNAHFFAGSTEDARRFLDMDFTISFTGVITFTRDYDGAVQYVPRDMLHAETDAPFVAPEPHRGKRNEPTYVIEVAKKLAEIRGEDAEALRKQLLVNAQRVFGISL